MNAALTTRKRFFSLFMFAKVVIRIAALEIDECLKGYLGDLISRPLNDVLSKYKSLHTLKISIFKTLPKLLQQITLAYIFLIQSVIGLCKQISTFRVGKKNSHVQYPSILTITYARRMG